MHSAERTFFQGEGLMTVRHLTIQGTNFEIGRRIGELAIQRFGKSPSEYVADPVFARARRVYFQQNYPIHWERVRGVAAAFGLDPNDDRYDLTGIRYFLDVPMPPAGCSVVFYPPSATDSASGYLSRNYDFSTGTIADLMHLPIPREMNARLPPVMGEPCIMEWYPQDGGYASLAIQAFDLVSGTLDGINSAGLVVSVMADEEAMVELGHLLEVHQRSPRAAGVHELQLMRWLLDTCATVDDAKDVLLTAREYYMLVPCHYIIADRFGRSFIYENSSGRNVQHVMDGGGKPQVVTNYQIHKHPNIDAPPEPLTGENNAFWRYGTLAKRIAEHQGLFSKDDLKANNACVNVQRMLAAISQTPVGQSIAAGLTARTLWHSLYDLNARSVEFSFYLSETMNPDGTRTENRSEYLKFKLKESA